MTQSTTSRLLRLALAGLLLIAFALAAGARPSNKWRLQCSGGADSDGTVVIRILPVGGEPIDTSVDIEDGTGENDVAKAIVKALKANLSKDIYHVERDDGEDVLIKRRHGAADFQIEVISITVEGVRISPDRE